MFEIEKHDSVYNRIRYLLSAKRGIHKYAKIRVDSFNFLLLEKTMTFHNVIILIKSVFSKGKNNYHYNIFLQNFSYELRKK